MNISNKLSQLNEGLARRDISLRIERRGEWLNLRGPLPCNGSPGKKRTQRISLGLPLDSSVFVEFQSKTKHYNYIFANTIDFIHEFFKFDNSFKNLYSKKLFDFLETNNLFKKYTTKFADKGIIF